MGRTPNGETRQKIMEFVRERLLHGEPPTIREIQEHFGFRAVQTARAHLDRLVEEGRLLATPGKSRGYRLPGMNSHPDLMWVPVVGRVQAGHLTEAIEDPDGFVSVERPSRGRASNFFALRVAGDSMEGVGIYEDDIVIVRQSARANDGEIVVARIEDEATFISPSTGSAPGGATVKRLRLRRGRVELHPENDAYEPIIPHDPSQVQILGRVIEVRRRLQ